MGMQPSAKLVYGQVLPNEFARDLGEALPVDGPLDFTYGGSVEWPRDACSTVVYLKGTEAGSFDTTTELGSDRDGIGVLPKVDVADVVNAQKLWRHLELPGAFEPRWTLIASYG